LTKIVGEGDMNARTRARDHLGKVLYEALERLDPGFGEMIEWENLPARDRELYRLCIAALLDHWAVLLEAAGDS
jgi:hypothetical protein